MGNDFLTKSKAYCGVPYQEKYVKHLSCINIETRRSNVQGLKALVTKKYFITLILSVCCVKSIYPRIDPIALLTYENVSLYSEFCLSDAVFLLNSFVSLSFP